jgi:TRAP-type C4-dicarboxylate transport system permease small subunit
MLEGIAARIDRAGRIGGWIAAAAIFAILALVAVEMLLRGVMGVSTQVSDEMSGYLNVAAIYFGLAVALRDGTYVRVEPVFNRLTGWAALLVRWIIVLVSIAYVCVSTKVMLGYIAYSYEANILSTSYSEAPLWIPQSFIVAGSVLLVLQLAGFALRGCRTVP